MVMAQIRNGMAGLGRKRLFLRRKLAIADATMRKAQRTVERLALDVRRFERKRAQLDAQITQMRAQLRHAQRQAEMARKEYKTQKRRLDRIS